MRDGNCPMPGEWKAERRIGTMSPDDIRAAICAMRTHEMLDDVKQMLGHAAADVHNAARAMQRDGHEPGDNPSEELPYMSRQVAAIFAAMETAEQTENAALGTLWGGIRTGCLERLGYPGAHIGFEPCADGGQVLLNAAESRRMTDEQIRDRLTGVAVWECACSAYGERLIGTKLQAPPSKAAPSFTPSPSERAAVRSTLRRFTV